MPNPSNQPDALQIKQLAEKLNNNPQELIPILENIIGDLREAPFKLRDLYHKKNYGQLAEAAHKYKSSLSYLGSESLTEWVNQLMLDSKHRPETADLSGQIGQIMTHARAYLPELLQYLSALKKA
jgi:HPt (histidine-containing phosphotransfer) domain-containing protein